MAKPRIVHALLNDTDELIPGAHYQTLCGTVWEHQRLTAEDMRERYVCALCVDRQNAEFVAALEALRSAYNQHLETFHPAPDIS